MFAETQMVRLGSGLEIACDEYGDPGGAPVFFFHGWPASRLQGAGFGVEARELGVRLLSLDRPGVGRSTLQPARRLLDWPPVVAEVARVLGVERFRVLAISGGGPYGLAVAWALPEMVQTVAVISGAPPLPREAAPGELMLAYRWLLAAYRRQPALLRRLFQAGRPLATIRPPHWVISQLLRLGPALDHRALSDPEVYYGSFDCYREAWRGSALGVAIDGEVHGEPWGFRPEEIRVPVRLWHGSSDRSFGWQLAKRLGDSIPNCAVRIVPDEGHYSLPIHHRREILEDLMNC